MTKFEFLAALEARLPGLSEADRRKTLEYYSEMIDDRTDDGLSQEEAVEAIGSLDDLVSEICLSSADPERGRQNGDQKEKTFPVEGSIRSIRIEAKVADVTFVPSENGRSYVVTREEENLETTVSVSGGELFIQQTAQPERRRRFRLVIFSSCNSKITVYLAKNAFDALDVNTLSGDVKIGKPFCFTKARIHTTSGDIRFEASVAEELKIKAISGDLEIENVNADRISCEATSGDIDLEAVTAGTISCKTISGDIDLKACDAASLSLSATSGDVEGTLLTEKVFTVHTVTGDKDVPKTNSGGTCHISTVSGDVKISIL